MFLPPFDDFADPRRLVDLAIAAEESDWDGFFLWDHVLRWFQRAGATWALWHFFPPAPADDIMKAVGAGPQARAG